MRDARLVHRNPHLTMSNPPLMSSTSESAPRVATPPFDGEFSDVILRTWDQVDFHLHKNILSMSSPFFRDMFSLTQPQTPSDTNDVPVIDIPETADLFDRLLRFCYPTPDPEIQTTSQILPIFKIAEKYGMEGTVVNLRLPLERLIPDYAREVFAISCRYGMESVAMKAAVSWHGTSHQLSLQPAQGVSWTSTLAGGTYVEEMGEFSSGPFFRLLQFLKSKRGQSSSSPSSPSSFAEPPWDLHPEPSSLQGDIEHPQNEVADFSIMDTLPGQDLIVQSTDSIRYIVHQNLLAASSSVLRDSIQSAQHGAIPAEPAVANFPVLTIAENGEVLRALMEACYPINCTSVSSWTCDFAGSVLIASVKYKLPRLEEIAKGRLTELARSDPLAVFCVAAKAGWKQGAREAALRFCRLRVDEVYSPELERTPTRYYAALLMFHHDYQQGLFRACSMFPGIGNEVYSNRFWNTQLYNNEEVYPELIWLATTESVTVRNNSGYSQYSSCSPEQKIQYFISFKGQLQAELSKVNLQVSSWQMAPWC